MLNLLYLFILQVTHYLGGENYVFWGGREGYQTLLNTDMGRELDHLVSYFLCFSSYKVSMDISTDN